MTKAALSTSYSGTRSPTAAWATFSFVCLALMARACNAEAVVGTVNQPEPEAVSEKLEPYVDQFEQVLRDCGFEIATERAPQNLDLRLSLALSRRSITISTELLQNGQALVATPAKNWTVLGESAVAETVPVATRKFARDVARYVASVGGVSAGACAAAASSGASVSQGRPPVRSWRDVKVYFHPPDNRYEEIGLLAASSKFSWSFSVQRKVDKVVNRLRVEAAKKGANGVLLVGVGNEYAGSVNTSHATATAVGNTAYGNSSGTSVAVMYEAGSAIAIYVYEAEVAGGPSVQASPAVQAVGVASSPPTVHGEDKQSIDEIYDAILKLGELRKRGLITDAEFNAEKQKVLASH